MCPLDERISVHPSSVEGRWGGRSVSQSPGNRQKLPNEHLLVCGCNPPSPPPTRINSLLVYVKQADPQTLKFKWDHTCLEDWGTGELHLLHEHPGKVATIRKENISNICWSWLWSSVRDTVITGGMDSSPIRVLQTCPGPQATSIYRSLSPIKTWLNESVSSHQMLMKVQAYKISLQQMLVKAIVFCVDRCQFRIFRQIDKDSV